MREGKKGRGGAGEKESETKHESSSEESLSARRRLRALSPWNEKTIVVVLIENKSSCSLVFRPLSAEE